MGGGNVPRGSSSANFKSWVWRRRKQIGWGCDQFANLGGRLDQEWCSEGERERERERFGGSYLVASGVGLRNPRIPQVIVKSVTSKLNFALCVFNLLFCVK